MKNLVTNLPRLLALSVLLWTVQTASAFYEPSLQRWLNRDPIGQSGFEIVRASPSGPSVVFAEVEEWPNLYCFVHNNPVSHQDMWGLKLTPQDCQNFLKDCYQDIGRLFGVGAATGAGKGTCVAGVALAAGKRYGSGVGKTVAGVGSLWTLIGAGRSIGDALERRRQCTHLYERCLESQGL